ncbi:MAG TPA: hypothetical protein VMZ28_20580 [Kofleriaceae bacterium]|nr:hypothetical protein [Kofleriaceae bacterium]
MRRAAALLAAVAAVAAVAALSACKGKKSSDLAELTEVLAGRAERTHEEEAWRGAAAGDRFRTGDAVRTSPDGGARLRFTGGGGLKMGADTTIRFGAGKVAIEGELTAEQDAVLDLELGRAEISAGSRVMIERHGDEVRFDVLVGRAVVTRDDEVTELAAGEALDVEVGGAKVQRIAGRAAAPKPDAGAARPGSDAGPSAPAGGEVIGEVKGAAAKARSGGGAWKPLATGRHDLAAGTEVSVPRGGTLLIQRGDETAEVRGAAEVVVAPEGAGGALAEARGGRTQVRATAADVRIKVPGGTIVARRGKGAGSRADLTIDKGKTSIQVDTGVVEVTGDKGGVERLVLGQSGELGRNGSIEVRGREPDRADFSIAAGLSASIHDPAPPSDLRVRFGAACPGAGVLEVTRGESFGTSLRRVQGEGAAIVRLDKGAYRYRVRCIADGRVADAASESGRLRVTRDAGTKPLPRRAPQNTVDADGRRYTVLYQNLLPSITFRWANAPASGSYRLTVAPARGKAITADAKTARHTLAAGKLAEGEYTYWFEGGGATSKKSVLRIDFDNAAASGYVQSPRPGAAWPGATVEVSGGAVEGWKVAAGGKALGLDRQGRFSGMVSRAADENGVAVELSHPTRGVHLYVRRPKR